MCIIQITTKLYITTFLILSGLVGINYLEGVGRICARTGRQPFSRDEAKNACSVHENCVGYMNRIFKSLESCDHNSGYGCSYPTEEDKGEYLICFNNGRTPFISIPDVEGNEKGQIKIYKKDYQGKDVKW